MHSLCNSNGDDQQEDSLRDQDAAAVRAVVREAERKHFTWSAQLAGIASTASFQAK